ncbi:AraC-like DNA-binding protein [Actinokineospora baliensis]|uniref:helix-turn-helix domain-containing protein n=1 Tax=Actinokineospora baliensis TaxID=547056 RepID=UPI0027DB1CF4|nr:helix-turn-helix domain-containing protein [Actinokineospora baliensis]MBM7774496.1 AraC-like DNA-binding protein [Actinokineospora baliensis]
MTPLLRDIHDLIDARLADPDLTPAGIAAAVHISTRQLYRLFESEGTTVAKWIRDRRLERCRADLLTEPAGVSAVGARWGIPDSSYFSRAFRQRYGCAPRDYRRTSAAA